jgi:hypothetical protein
MLYKRDIAVMARLLNPALMTWNIRTLTQIFVLSFNPRC